MHMDEMEVVLDRFHECEVEVCIVILIWVYCISYEKRAVLRCDGM